MTKLWNSQSLTPTTFYWSESESQGHPRFKGGDTQAYECHRMGVTGETSLERAHHSNSVGLGGAVRGVRRR